MQAQVAGARPNASPPATGLTSSGERMRSASKIAVGLALLVTLVGSGALLAKPSYARLEGKDCIFCHTHPQGGKKWLNPTGKYYRDFSKIPVPGALVQPKPGAGPAPMEAWHPEREPARIPVGSSRTEVESERQVKARMARWTRSLGAKNCYYCHVEKLPGASLEQQREGRLRYEIAQRHQELTDQINRTLGGDKVSCYTCHLGGRGPVTMPGSNR